MAAAPPGEENGRTSEIPDGDDAPLPKASDMAIESGHRMADSRMADSQEGDTQEGDKGEGDVNREDGPSKDVEEAEGGLRTEEEEMEEGGNDELAREDAEKQRDEVAVVEKLVEVEAELPEEEEEEEEAEGEDEEEELVDDSNNADVKPEEPGDEDEDGGDGNPPAAGEGGSHAEVPDDRQGGAAEPEGGKGHPEADKGGKAEGGETHAGGQHQAAFLNVESAPLQPRREDKGQQAEARGEAPAAPVRSVGVSDALSHLKVTPAGNVRARAAWAEEMARKSCQPDEGRRPPAVGWKDLELAAANKPKLVPRDPNVPHPMVIDDVPLPAALLRASSPFIRLPVPALSPCSPSTSTLRPL